MLEAEYSLKIIEDHIGFSSYFFDTKTKELKPYKKSDNWMHLLTMAINYWTYQEIIWRVSKKIADEVQKHNLPYQDIFIFEVHQ